MLDFVECHDEGIGCVTEVCTFGEDAVGSVHERGCKAQGLRLGNLVIRLLRGGIKFGGLYRNLGIYRAHLHVRGMFKELAVLAGKHALVGTERLAANLKQSNRRNKNLNVLLVHHVEYARHRRVVIWMHLQQPDQRAGIQEKNAALSDIPYHS